MTQLDWGVNWWRGNNLSGGQCVRGSWLSSRMGLGGGLLPVVVAVAVMAPPVLRLLCVHGYRQDGRIFRERTGSLRKALRKRAELLYVSSPLRVPPPLGTTAQPPAAAGDGESLQEDGRGWWFSNPVEDSFNALDHVETCKGLEESLETISKAMAELGPFDGIMGFSQGAALVAMVCALKQKGDPRFQFDFAILVAGFKSRCKLHEHFYQEPIAIPSLHVFGDTDRVIPGELSQDLSKSFVDPVILTHTGGHFVPVSAPQKLVYSEFLERFQKK
ncbi:esterase OVCA2 isoform X2 [Chiloscyllium plagiosum]|uniref:esterase OVCA2 isoform X2 n=1 Tax=Chiloscyllium plagiosum TaxID=36176 RepID=UPI001CB7F381|nr:esterase OVCA2 isoform X2 [Chiloscyllium plagiosum]